MYFGTSIKIYVVLDHGLLPPIRPTSKIESLAIAVMRVQPHDDIEHSRHRRYAPGVVYAKPDRRLVVR
jgi:hypothetical protein